MLSRLCLPSTSHLRCCCSSISPIVFLKFPIGTRVLGLFLNFSALLTGCWWVPQLFETNQGGSDRVVLSEIRSRCPFDMRLMGGIKGLCNLHFPAGFRHHRAVSVVGSAVVKTHYQDGYNICGHLLCCITMLTMLQLLCRPSSSVLGDRR